MTEAVSKVVTVSGLSSSNLLPTFGQSITLTNTITLVNGVAPTGLVSFYNGATLIGTATPNSSGVATLTTSALPVGSDPITAMLATDANYAQVDFERAARDGEQGRNGERAEFQQPPSDLWPAVTLTNTITLVNGVAPTGLVSFYNGATLIGTATPNASGVATLTTSALPVGSDPITAVLASDSNYAQVTSNLQTETVGKAAGADVLTTSNPTPTFGQSVTLTDTIPVMNGVAPTGTVSFYNGATLLGTGVPNASGVATLATTALPVGTDSVTQSWPLIRTTLR